jgi:hypothetical protein
LLEQGGELKDLLRKKERVAVLERNPFHQPLIGAR